MVATGFPAEVRQAIYNSVYHLLSLGWMMSTSTIEGHASEKVVSSHGSKINNKFSEQDLNSDYRQAINQICEILNLQADNLSDCQSSIVDLVADLKKAQQLLLRSRTGLSNMIKQELFVFLAHEEQSRQELKKIDNYLQASNNRVPS